MKEVRIEEIVLASYADVLTSLALREKGFLSLTEREEEVGLH
jgi:hypothetical protein